MNKVIAFVIGAAAGSLVTWKIVEKKYKKLADEEIASVIEHFKKKEEIEEKIEKVETFDEKIENPTLEFEEVEVSEEEVKVYVDKVKDLGYSQDEETEEGSYPAPYVISPEEFGDFETRSWTYYADGILTDEDDMIIEDPENIIGDALEHFGEYADDSVYVRNEFKECDYEILKHDRPFDEIEADQ